MAQRAPGKAFRKGISLIELFKMFPDEEAATKWFEELKWGENREYFCCPRCGGMDKVRLVPSGRPMPYWCGDCRRNFSVRTGTVMERSKIPLQKWAIAIYLNVTNLKGVASMKLHRDLDITYKSAWFMGHRIREAMKDEGMQMFEGPVEVDETYIGGLERNKPESKRLKEGRGPVNKTAVVGAKDRNTNQVSAAVVENVTGETLQELVHNWAAEGSEIYTDDHRGYKGLKDSPYEHKSVKHSIGEFVDDMAHTNGIESFWSMLKKGYHGTYHKMSKKHLQRYVNEFTARHNLRPMDTLEQMKVLAGNMIGRRLKYQELIG